MVQMVDTPLAHIHTLWREALKGLGASADDALVTVWFGFVQGMYEQLFRRYHTLVEEFSTMRPEQGHIESMLEILLNIKSMVRSPAHMIIAVILHDVIYDPRSRTNEADSAAFARTMLILMGVPRHSINSIMRLIMATRHRGTKLRSNDERTIADIDLAGFGKSWDTVLKNSRDVRREFAHVPDDDFAKGHAEFILSLLRRPRIYYTEHFHGLYEERARGNMKMILSEMKRSIVNARPTDKRL
jgi:predicted metal-dependent HD superfamily phosphohydrolase